MRTRGDEKLEADTPDGTFHILFYLPYTSILKKMFEKWRPIKKTDVVTLDVPPWWTSVCRGV